MARHMKTVGTRNAAPKPKEPLIVGMIRKEATAPKLMHILKNEKNVRTFSCSSEFIVVVVGWVLEEALLKVFASSSVLMLT